MKWFTTATLLKLIEKRLLDSVSHGLIPSWPIWSYEVNGFYFCRNSLASTFTHQTNNRIDAHLFRFQNSTSLEWLFLSFFSLFIFGFGLQSTTPTIYSHIHMREVPICHCGRVIKYVSMYSIWRHRLPNPEPFVPY